MPSHFWSFALAILLLFVNAFFVAAEFSLVKIRETRLEELAGRGHRLARMALGMVRDLDSYLSATQLGITLASLALGYVGEPAFHWLMSPLYGVLYLVTPEYQHTVALTLSFLFFSTFHIILGELVPKSLAIQTTEKVLFAVVLPLRIFTLVGLPFLWLLQGCSNLVLKAFRLNPVRKGHIISETELKLIVEDTVEAGTLEKSKQDLLTSIFAFTEKRVGEIMVPVDKAFCFYLDLPIEKNLVLAHESQHTRYPLFDTRGGKVLGFVHIKDIIWNFQEPRLIHLLDMCRLMPVFKEGRRIDSAMRELKSTKTHIAVVVNEAGEARGFVTLEDVLEELVGNIQDEFDEEFD